MPARRKPLPRGKGLERGTGLVRRTPLGAGGAPAPTAPARSRRQTGFSVPVKLTVRKRAGGGDIDQAACEACGQWLGRYGGNVQHIVARGMGGTSNPVLSTAANAALLCGLTPQDPDGCHYLAESRHKEMRERGFWLKQGTDPRTVSMTLHAGDLAWRSEDGSYLSEAPLAGAV